MCAAFNKNIRKSHKCDACARALYNKQLIGDQKKKKLGSG